MTWEDGSGGGLAKLHEKLHRECFAVSVFARFRPFQSASTTDVYSGFGREDCQGHFAPAAGIWGVDGSIEVEIVLGNWTSPE